MGVEAEEGVVEAEEGVDTRRPTTCMMKMPRRRIRRRIRRMHFTISFVIIFIQ